jgi:TolA-binding protein
VLLGLRAVLAPLALVAAVATAPFQCASETGPERRMYEDASEVLYDLAERFKASGDRQARVATLRYLAERYPTSRFAHMARMDLEALGEAQPAGTAGEGEGTPPP